MSWAALEAGAPDMAREGWARFERTHVALLGTTRADGSPRISPVEPFIIEGRLVFGVMPSPKWDDLKRDNRLVLHSSVSDINGTEGEFKVYGRGVPTDEPAVTGHADAWWFAHQRDRYEVYAVEIGEAVLVVWQADQSRMRTSRWTPGAGRRDRERSYP
jgi:hypothetical protein